MITYVYWIIVIALAASALLASTKIGKKTGILIAAFIMFAGWGLHSFYLEQIFVKRWGGTMSLSVPSGQHHIGATWKDDNLWINNFDPKTNKCYFREYSRGNVLEGKVVIKDCSPFVAQ